MSNKKYILKRNWQSKIGAQEILYLGRNSDNKIDCVENKEEALVMTKEDAEGWLLIIPHGHKLWSIEEIEIKQEVIEEKNNDTV